MSKIEKAFEKGKVFIGFITGGDPCSEKTEEFVFEMIAGGADIIEIGIPFSDPVAEGPTIQSANIRALASGTTIDKLFTIIENLRKKTQIPLLFMTYLNPVFNYGYERFFTECERVGLNGIIIPDLPFEEKKEVSAIAHTHQIDLITMVAPTSENRIEKLVSGASGFIYTVSSMGVTGVRNELDKNTGALLAKVKSKAHIPVAAGFGIGTPEQAQQTALHADGVIVGSAIVHLVEKYGDDAGPYIREFVSSMKEAIKVK